MAVEGQGKGVGNLVGAFYGSLSDALIGVIGGVDNLEKPSAW